MTARPVASRRGHGTPRIPARLLALLAAVALGATAAAAEPPWRTEFDAVCGKTQDAMALSTEELQSLVARCDALRPALEALEESARKVYVRRLKGCRDLYQFVLDFRQRGGA